MRTLADGPTTLGTLIWESIEQHPDRKAQGWWDGSQWVHRTYKEFGAAINATARSLIALGVKPGDRVAIWSRNNPQWAEVDLANQTAGFVSVPIYDTLTGEKGAFILNDSETKVVFVQNADLLQRVLDVAESLKTVKKVVVIQGEPTLEDEDVLSWEQFQRLGDAPAGDPSDRLNAKLAEYRAAVKPDDLASLVYTSGTTADPKGVMLTHWNFASNAVVACNSINIFMDDVLLSFLPLSHVFERLGGHFAAYAGGAHVVFARSIDTLMDDMGAIKPTIVLSVPRLYEKMHSRVLDSVNKSSWVKRKIFEWAVEQGRAANVYRQRGEPIPRSVEKRVERADKLVFHKVKARVGGRLRFFVSGGAPLSREIEEFFWANGICILQGYGLTETSPVTNLNTFENLRFGSVGKCVPGVQIKIDTASWTSMRADVVEGEICFKGPNITQGYWKNKKATKESFDDEGWFHTGDIGYLDEDGFLFITDRKKEIIVMSNGKKVTPQAVEGALKLQPHIAQACIIGDDRNYIAALVVPDFEALDSFALKNGIATSDRARLVADQRVVSLIEQEVEAVNATLSRYEQIKKFWILPAEWTVETGELTPTLKIKRRVVSERFKDVIGKLYAGGQAAE